MKHKKLLSGLTAFFLTVSAIPFQGTDVHGGTKDASHSRSDKYTLTAAAAAEMLMITAVSVMT